MIKKLLDIKKLGIFDDYHWDANLPEFKRFNLIYGWNGSGKTTLSCLFSALESCRLAKHPELKYKIETEEGEYNHKTPYIKKIRVFNQDYISQNLDLLSCKANPIFILGEENKKLAESIRNDEMILRGNPDIPGNFGKLKDLELKQAEVAQKEAEIGSQFTNVAKIIGTTISGVSTRVYRKNNAEDDFKLLTKKKILSNKELEQFLTTIKQQEMKILEEVDIKNLEKDGAILTEDASELLKRTVEVIAIKRLQENPNISRWVEDGYKLHIKENSKSCEFCGQSLSEDRLKILAGYFNDADKKLKEDIDNLIHRLESYKDSIQNLTLSDEARLLEEFREEYLINSSEINNTRNNLITAIDLIIDGVNNKKLHTTEAINLPGELILQPFIISIEVINNCIKKHNDKTQNFSKAKLDAEEIVKNHYLSEIYDSIHSLNADVEKLKNEIDVLNYGDPDEPGNVGIKRLIERIEENKNKITESGLACDEINQQLETFLGRRELEFETNDEGYLIRRNGEIAKDLSEGEKTAISFVYFTIHLKDRDFDIKNDIVVVDDPISSLDSNSMFQAFSFLKNAVEEGNQIFILTHNYDFLQLLIEWLTHISKSRTITSFYMIKNPISNGIRSAKLDKLDKLLLNYNSEYQYLFSVLYNFESDGTLESVYPLPNIARKVLESFLAVMIPDNSTPKQKLDKIKFDNNKKTAIYKFTNAQSHLTGKGFDPSLLSEAQNVISYIKEMMKDTFPLHYEVLENSAKNIEAT